MGLARAELVDQAGGWPCDSLFTPHSALWLPLHSALWLDWAHNFRALFHFTTGMPRFLEKFVVISYAFIIEAISSLPATSSLLRSAHAR